MKKIRYILIILAAMAVSSCYDSYVKDYTNSTIYCAFQYDLRTFVVGEGMKFDFTVGLAGVMENGRNRAVSVTMEDAFVTQDIPSLLGVEAASFTAYEGMIGKAPFGSLSQDYVSTGVKALGVKALTPLPSQYFTITGLDGMKIKKGNHTATATITATDAFLADPKAIAPYYAIAFKIGSADADVVPADKSFEVIAVKYECKYFGYWYHGGKTQVVDNLTGKVISEDSYALVLPQEDSKVYTLTTTGPNSVKTNKIGQKAGELYLTFDGEKVDVTSPGREITIGYCYTNNAKLIQDRVIGLNYSFDNGDGTTTVVSDKLTFRNRIRDGINEWQDENPENYE